MRWQSQGYNECQLATIAMLADVPLRYVRKFALSLGEHKTWETVGLNPVVFWERVVLIAAFFGLPETLFPEGVGTRKHSTTTSGSKRPILGGLGQIHLGSDLEAHAVAYQDGRIYDSNIRGCLTWKQLLRRYPWAWRFKIYREDGKEVQWRKA